MDRISLVIAAACGAAASAQSPDARTIVQAAAEAMQSVQTATYEAQLEVRGATAPPSGSRPLTTASGCGSCGPGSGCCSRPNSAGGAKSCSGRASAI